MGLFVLHPVCIDGGLEPFGVRWDIVIPGTTRHKGDDEGDYHNL
jgi:hypothetical protein